MSLKEYASEEFKRSPVTVIATVIGVIVAVFGLLLAWLQFNGQPSIPVADSPGAVLQTNRLNLSNLALAIAFFLAATFASASMIRMLARVHDFAALFISVPSAVLSAFISLVVLYLAPPKVMNEAAFTVAVDTVFYGTVLIYFAINGLPVIKDLAVSTKSTKSVAEAPTGKGSTDGGAILLLIVFLMIIWGNFVSSGLSKLVKMFLT
jgi:hypothetical protein